MFYEYRCIKGHKFEELRTVAERDYFISCPECGKEAARIEIPSKSTFIMKDPPGGERIIDKSNNFQTSNDGATIRRKND